MTLGDRMKAYEKAYDLEIIGRVPVIVRVDGKGFSKWTKSIKAEKPFDEQLNKAMSRAMCDTASSIEGCLFGYTQSDEMTFVLRNDQSLESTPWFGNRIQKICSVVSSMVTVNFAAQMCGLPRACFDARVFAVPTVQEAINCLVWRQNDAVKNSVSASCYYEVAKSIGKKTTRKLMHGLNQKQQQELLFQNTGINWNNYSVKFKRGTGCYRKVFEVEIDGNVCQRSNWEIDEELPTFTQEPDYLNNILSVGEDSR